VLDASGRSADADRAFRTGWTLDAGDPIKAYYAFRRTATVDDAPADGARETLAAAYRSLAREKPRAKAAPFIALGVLRDPVSDEPVLPPAGYAQGFARLARGEYAEAIAEFRKAAAIDPMLTDPAARSASMTQAVAAVRQGRLEQARSLLEGAEAFRDSSEAHRVLGLVYWANAQDDKSIGELQVAIRRNPRDERSRLVLARVLSSAGRDSDAERVLQETIQAFPYSAQARWWLGLGHERVNRFADARREFELAAPSAVAGRSRFFAKIGQLASSAADLPGAVEAFARSVSLELNDPESHKQLAGALLQQDRAEEAFAELIAALLIDPLDAGAHFGIGQIHLNAGRYDESVTALRRALELSENHAEARYALATALMRTGNAQEAAREFDRVQQAQRQALADRRRSMSLDVLKEEAALRIAEGNYGAAIALYEKAITSGADPAVYRQLAELYMKVGRVDDAARAKARAR
jgi:tetratricopeptide (TPR) repeat protein